ncbi:MAG: hypothetical protein GQ574_04140 [Crocinitomix sp.]|nr:hypothetical protein [Crocinitomix sp.]
MKQKTQLKKDLANVKETFPKLVFKETRKQDFLIGDIDISDTDGNYFATYKVKIIVPVKYPHGVPKLIEISKLIPRDDDRHIDKNGICCVNMEHELILLARRKLLLFDFIKDQVYPYLANQQFFDKNKKFAGDEYPHFFEGIIKFYSEKLDLTNHTLSIKFLEAILNNQIPSRNDVCLCGEKSSNGKYLKIKNCHQDTVDFLKSVGQEQLKKDLKGFKQKKLNDHD